MKLDSADIVSEQHTLAIGDQLMIEFPYRPDYNREVLLRTDGKISLPLIGTLKAVGRTPEALERDIRTLYAAASYDPVRQAKKEYRLAVGDRIDLKFQSAEQLNDSAVLRPDGRISLPLIKSILAEGKTPEELQTELEHLYAAHLKNPELIVIVRSFTTERVFVDGHLQRSGVKDLDDATVAVRSFAPRQVYVAGEVRTPGFVNYQPPLTALQAIMAAGGPSRTGTLRKVLVLRKIGVEQPTATLVNLKTDAKGETNNDVALRAFDIVIVPMSGIAKVQQALDEYFYQLIPAARNLNFTFFYNLGNLGGGLP